MDSVCRTIAVMMLLGAGLVPRSAPAAPGRADAPTTLTAQQIYDRTLEHYQGLGGAALRFRWTPPGGRKATVPAWALEHETKGH